MNRKYTFYFLIYFVLFQYELAEELINKELDYIDLKQIPHVLDNDNVNLTVLYQCSSLTKRRISLSIRIEQTLYRKNVSIFRRHWFCQSTSYVQTVHVRIQLPRSIAYASDIPSNLQSWPIETGQLNLLMFDSDQTDEKKIIKQIQYNVRFLPVHQRPKIRSIRWNPFINKTTNEFCLKEPGEVFNFLYKIKY